MGSDAEGSEFLVGTVKVFHNIDSLVSNANFPHLYCLAPLPWSWAESDTFGCDVLSQDFFREKAQILTKGKC